MHNLISEPMISVNKPVLDSLPVAILIIDQKGMIHYHNSSADNIFNSISPKPVNITRLSSSFKKSHFLRALNSFKNHHSHIFETKINFNCGQLEGLYQLKMVIHSDDDQLYLITLYPITATNKSIYEQDSLKYALLKKNFKELKQFSRISAMREIASSMADQLNQPLTALLSYTQAMQRLYQCHASSEEIHDAMERVVINAEHAGQIIRNIRTQLNANTLHCQKTSINQLVQDSIHLTELDSPASAIKLVTQFDPSSPSLFVDTIQIKQVMLNLLNNAIDAVMIPSIETPEIYLSTSLNDLQFKITIEDNGPGITQEAQNKLFEPFFSTKKNGIGIGLSMCHHIIGLHNGSINIVSKDSSDENQTGTIVTIYLPCSPGIQTCESNSLIE